MVLWKIARFATGVVNVQLKGLRCVTS